MGQRWQQFRDGPRDHRKKVPDWSPTQATDDEIERAYAAFGLVVPETHGQVRPGRRKAMIQQYMICTMLADATQRTRLMRAYAIIVWRDEWAMENDGVRPVALMERLFGAVPDMQGRSWA